MSPLAATWSDDRVEQLKKLWEVGLSCTQIAAELGGVTRNAVIGKIHRLGLSGRTRNVDERQVKRRFKPAPAAKPSRRVLALQKAIAEATSDQHATNLEAAAEFDPSAISVSDAEIPLDRRITSIVDLDETHCRWPIGEVGTDAFYFCGAGGRKLDGLPYCARHARIAYTTAAERADGRRQRNVSEEERARRSERMKELHAQRRAAAS